MHSKYKLCIIPASGHFLILEAGYIYRPKRCSLLLSTQNINYRVNLSVNDFYRLKHSNFYSEFIRRDYRNRNSITITGM